ncbi:MAG: ATP cone domain-containing protein [Gemmataceae bacterium]
MREPAPPSWVCKRDGSLAPFEADRLSRALFAVTERLGRPDAFLARELADTVVHFLAVDCEGETPTTTRIAEVVDQVLTELGQHDLARGFRAGDNDRTANRRAGAAGGGGARLVARRAVHPRPDGGGGRGVIVLTGQDTADALDGCVLGAEVPLDGAFDRARRLVGRLIAVDGLEYLAGERSTVELAAAVTAGQTRTGRQVVVNLNVATPPGWADALAAGPLFADQSSPVDEEGRLREAADGLFDVLAPAADGPAVRIDWHLSARDFEPVHRDRLLVVTAAMLAGMNVGLVCDRPRRPVALAEGLDRRRPVTLLLVGLNLPALARQPGMLADPPRYLQRLGSLVRLGLSVAVQKRDHVRRVDRRRAAGGDAAPGVTSGFLLDRARFVAVPLGLDETVRLMTGWGLANGGPSLELGRQIVRRLREVLDQEGRLAQMDVCLDAPAAATLAADVLPTRETAAGLTPWDDRASLTSQVRAAGALHAIAEGGTVTLFPEPTCTAANLADAVARAWRSTEVVRLVVARPGGA